MKPIRSASDTARSLHRRHFLAAGAATVATAAVARAADKSGEPSKSASKVVTPPEGKRLLLSCKMNMIRVKGSLADRLGAAGEAGFAGVDFDCAGGYKPEQVRDAVQKSGVFVHNAINHAHWKQRLTSPKTEERARAVANIEHCMRVSHAAGGCGVLIVVGKGEDGEPEVIEERCRQEIKKMLPLAAALGQPILIENVWNRMFYDHDKGPEQSAERFVKFIDSFNSPWVGLYFDIGNHWKYGQPGEWIRELGRRCVKCDVKGFSRAKGGFTQIGAGDLPWGDVRKALDEIGFTGWVTAETGGGGLKRLKQVREQMEKVFQV